MLTKQQLRAAARHARELASEICEGVAPPLFPYSYCGCATGEIVKRLLGIPEIARDESPEWKLAKAIDAYLPDDPERTLGEEGLVSAALRKQCWEPVTCAWATAVPLLWLADELENAAEGRPQKASP